MAATEERQALAELGEQQGWSLRENGRTDTYQRDAFRIRVMWQGDAAISGASYFQDEAMSTYTRELSKVRDWLQR